MASFSWFEGLAGGLMIGLATALFLIFNGRIAGISGIVAGLLSPKDGDIAWRLIFAGGIVAGALLTPVLLGKAFMFQLDVSWPVLVLGGFLVGFGTRLGSGCTSGHGVCGIGRFSVRSIAATLTFMATAIVTVFLTRHVL